MIEVRLNNKIKAPGKLPEELSYKEDIDYLYEELAPYIGKKVIVIGNGGSVTSFGVYREAFEKEEESQIVSSMDPELIEKTKRKFTPDNSVVVAVSKSGNTIGMIETLSCFSEYETIAVTEEKTSALYDMAFAMGWKIINHPAIGGRFSGGTSPALVPAIITGMDVPEITAGIERGYVMKDEAASLAKELFDLEGKGYTEIYVPVYPSALSGVEDFIEQLMHESVCKDGKGQTVYVAMGPECQHHTNQRIFGGRRNVAVLFIVSDDLSSDMTVSFPNDVLEIEAEGLPLGAINNLPLQVALEAEYLGTKKNTEEEGIPSFDIRISDSSYGTIGELIAFFHLVAIYSAELRGVNFADQPAVERSKDITIQILRSGAGF